MYKHVGPNGGQYYWGHGGEFTGAPFVYGDSVFFRWRFRWIPGADCRAYEGPGSNAERGTWRNKVMIVNDYSSPRTSRFIMHMLCVNYLGTGGDPVLAFTMAKGGGVDQTQTPYYTVDTNWTDIQVELQYSSAPEVADGAYRIWVNNNSQVAPSAEMNNILLHADVNPGFVRFGAYFNNAMFIDGTIGWEHVDFQIGHSFDDAWDIDQ